MKKNVLKSVLFVFIFLCLWNLIGNLFENNFINRQSKPRAHVYDLIKDEELEQIPKNELDILFLGSSHSFCTFIPSVFDYELKTNSFNFGTGNQSVKMSYLLLKKLIGDDYRPKVVILEGYKIVNDAMTIRDYYTGYSNINNKLNIFRDNDLSNYERLQATNDALFNKEEWKYFNFVKMSEELEKLYSKNGYFKIMQYNKDIVFEQNLNMTDKVTEIDKISKKYLDLIIELCNKHDIELKVVVAPHKLSEEYVEKYNYLGKYLEKRIVDYINYNSLIDELKLSHGVTYDGGHMNFTGALRISNHLTNILAEEIDFEDRSSSLYYQEKMKLSHFNEYLKGIPNDKLIVLTVENEGSRRLNKETNEKFKEMNAGKYSNKHFRDSYILIINNNEVLYEKVSNKALKKEINFKEQHFEISSTGLNSGNLNTYVKLNNEIIQDGKNGINILIYDIGKNKIIDSRNFNTYHSLFD